MTVQKQNNHDERKYHKRKSVPTSCTVMLPSPEVFHVYSHMCVYLVLGQLPWTLWCAGLQ